MAWFNSIGDGQLATLLRVRSKLHHGQKLQPWEQDYYRKNKAMVDLRPRLNPAEIAERQRLQRPVGQLSPHKEVDAFAKILCRQPSGCPVYTNNYPHRAAAAERPAHCPEKNKPQCKRCVLRRAGGKV